MSLSYDFPRHPTVVVNPGDVILTWCSLCMGQSPHRYEPAGKAKLVCVDCEAHMETRKNGHKELAK